MGFLYNVVMTIEAEFCSYKNREEKICGKRSIQPGTSEVITYLSPTNISVFLDIDNTIGEIKMKKPGRLMVVKYRGGDDKVGVRVDPSKPIEIKSGQEVRLIRKIGGTSKEAYFWLKHNDDSYEKIPDPEDRTTVRIST